MAKQRIVIRKKQDESNIEQSVDQKTQIRTDENLQNKKQTKPTNPEHQNKVRPGNKISNLKKLIYFSIGLLTATVFYFAISFFLQKKDTQSTSQTSRLESQSTFQTELFFDESGTALEYEKNIISEKTSLRDILTNYKVAAVDAKKLNQKAIAHGFNTLNSGDKYTMIFNSDNEALRLVVEPRIDPYSKYVVEITDLEIEKFDKEKEVVTKSMAAIIEHNLGVTFINNNLDLKLINDIEEIFAWSVDLFSLSDGDRFKILYDQEYLDGKPHKIVGINAAYFNQNGTDFYAYRYKLNNKFDFYNENGQSMKKSFLKTPLKYGGVITSGFGLRVHPVQGFSKMHFGTDYAAPEGTPIQAVADGVIEKAAFSTNNGNNVKIKHDQTYATQYLHMTRWADGIRPGSRVKQGDVIGFVGSTGLATGPHVCYRFWKNNEQVDPKKERVGTSIQIQASNFNDFQESISGFEKELKKIEYF